MYCVLIHAVFFPPYIEFSHIYCASLHVLFFLYILCAASCLTLGFMYCVLLHVLRLTPCIACCVVSRLVLDSMPYVLCHALCLTPCPVCCVMPCAWLHALCAVLCHSLCLTPMPVCHSIYPIFLHACQVSFWTYICFFKMIYPKFLWLTNRYPYFPFLLDIKSLTLLVYVQFSSDSIPFSHTLSLILDISCHFLFFISNFYPAKFVFHLHRPWLWIFPAIFS